MLDLQDKVSNSSAIEFITSNWFENSYSTSYFAVKISRDVFKLDMNTCDGTNVYGDTGSTPCDFLETHPLAVIGHNCDFGSATLTRPTRINGINYNTQESPHFYPLLAVDTVNETFTMYPSYTDITSVDAEYNYAFSVSHQLISGGVARTTFSNYTGQSYDWNTAKDPRIAWGYDDDNYYVFVCEGRDKCEHGMKLSEIAALMKDIFPNIYNAYNFDGGGSTVFAANTPKTNRINRMRDFELKFYEHRTNLLVMYYVEKEI